MRRLLLPCLAIAAVACGDDIRLLDPKPVAPLGNINVIAQHDSQTRIQVLGSLFTGRALDGYPHHVLDSVLTVNGESVSPHFTSDVDLQYLWERLLAAPIAIPESLTLLLPRVEVPGPDSLRVSFTVPARLGTYDVVLAPGEDLRLRITPWSQLALPLAVSPFWNMDVGTLCNGGPNVVHIQGTSAYPDTLVLSRSLLPAIGPFEACVRAGWGYTAATQPYRAGVFVSTVVKWRVQYTP